MQKGLSVPEKQDRAASAKDLAAGLAAKNTSQTFRNL
jgi:hypothetical protein